VEQQRCLCVARYISKTGKVLSRLCWRKQKFIAGSENDSGLRVNLFAFFFYALMEIAKPICFEEESLIEYFV